MTGSALALMCPALSMIQYDQGGELIFTFASTIWLIYFACIESRLGVSTLLSINYFFAPNTLFYYNIPIVFCVVGQVVWSELGQFRQGVDAMQLMMKASQAQMINVHVMLCAIVVIPMLVPFIMAENMNAIW